MVYKSYPVDEAHKHSEADIVYSVKLGEQTGYFYLLCEHQSSVDQMMAFRLLQYAVRLMDMHIQRHGKPLPLVFPMVLYTGEKPWKAPRDIMELFGNHSDLAHQVFLQPYVLIDVQQRKDDDLRKHLWSGMLEFALKHQRRCNFEAFLKKLFPWLNDIEIEQGENFAKIVLTYVLNGIEKSNEAVFIAQANKFLSDELRDEIMTIAQQIEKRGIQAGIQQGLIQGEFKFLTRLIQRKFGALPAPYLARVQQADAETLLKWGEKILEAKTLQEMFEE
jgi:predicted transposase/invertase (TIGR01784 family)